MNLLINYFKSSEKTRDKEYIFCLEENIKNEHIEKIFLFLEKEEHAPHIESGKIEKIFVASRPTFQTLIDYANNNLSGQVCILANSDIFFDETLGLAEDASLDKNFISLSRWDVKHDYTIEYYDKDDRGWTQDAWIFKTPCPIKGADFVFGIFGQDNRIMKLAYDADLDVINPSQVIIVKHYHISDFTGDSDSHDESKRLCGEYLYCKSSDNFDPPDYYEGALYGNSRGPKWEPKRYQRILKNVHTQEKEEGPNHNINVLVTGGTGLVGYALEKYVEDLQKENPFFTPNIKFIGSFDCDLRPKVVLHLAGRVGGIKANTDKIAEFYFDNMYINLNVLHFSHLYKVEKLVNMLSTCIYPDKVEYPIKEECLHDGPPHKSNYGYAYAKRMMEIQSRVYREQYKSNFINVIPNNIFGENDNFHLEDSHVIPAIIRKTYEAKLKNEPLKLWGDGSAMRQFTYSYDIAKILFLITKKYESAEPINIGCSDEISIRDVAQIVAACLEYDGNILWQSAMPSGQKRKPSDLTKLKGLGCDKFTDFKQAIKNTCDWFVENFPNVRGVHV